MSRIVTVTVFGVAMAINLVVLARTRYDKADAPPPVPQTQPSDLPAPIAQLKSKIQGKKSDEVLAIIRAQFGMETRSTGSGIYMPQWDIGGGVLTFHPYRGPNFSRGTPNYPWVYPSSGVMLIDTHNSVSDNLPGTYTMSTLLNDYRTRFVVGQVALFGGKYRFEPITETLAYSVKDVSNFFTAYPSGTCRTVYPKNVKQSSMMENLADQSVIVRLEFVAEPANKPAGATLSLDLRIDVRQRTLYFAPRIESPLTYQLEKSWKEFWK